MPRKAETKNDWKPVDEKNFRALYGHVKSKYPDIDRDTFINERKRSLETFINNFTWTEKKSGTEKKFSDKTRENLFFMIAKWLRRAGDKRNAKYYSGLGHELDVKNTNKEEENAQDPNEQKNYRDHQFFVNILEQKKEDAITTKEQHFKVLLLSLLTQQAVLRTSFYTTAKFITKKSDDNKTNNFVWINRRGKLTVHYIVNKDKVTNTRTFHEKKDLSLIPIEDQELAQMIYDSYKKYPRTYLFELEENKPVHEKRIISWLRSVTGVKGLNVNMMRSSYINWYYRKNLTVAQRRKLANQMRHTPATAQKHYLKVFEEEKTQSEEAYKKKIDELTQTIAEQQQRIAELEVKLSAHENIDGDNTNYRKKRNDIIYRANRGVKPKDDTLKKYNITWNEDDQRYE